MNLGSLTPELVLPAKDDVRNGDGGSLGLWCVVRDGVVRSRRIKRGAGRSAEGGLSGGEEELEQDREWSEGGLRCVWSELGYWGGVRNRPRSRWASDQGEGGSQGRGALFRSEGQGWENFLETVSLCTM